MTKFLEINGKNLEELYMCDDDLDLSIAKIWGFIISWNNRTPKNHLV